MRPQTKGEDYLINIMAELELIDKIKWAGMWCKLNSWQWPDELERFKPEWWTDLSYVGESNEKLMDQMGEIIRPVNSKIDETLGHRWISREWNKKRMTEEEHNIWWIKNHIND